MGKLFGTDGVRGIVGKDLSAELAFRLGRAAAEVLISEDTKRPKILIGKDTRLSGDMLESAMAAGFAAMGADVILLGVVPTPAVAYLLPKLGADAGVMISASHNPGAYNGIKIFQGSGYKLPDELELQIEDRIENGIRTAQAQGEWIGRVSTDLSLLDLYCDHVRALLPTDCKRRILFDLSNGSASQTAKQIFTFEGADFISGSPDGWNINEHCGSTDLSALKEKVVSGGYDMGIAFDGDADRCLAVDENGNTIDGDQIIAALSLAMRANGELHDDTIVVTSLSNLGLHLFAKANNLQVKVTDVGDRYVLEEMLRGNYSLGGEQSGHIIMTAYATTGDGQSSAAKILCLLANQPNAKASEVFGVMKVLPQIAKNVTVASRSVAQQILAHEKIAALKAKIEDALNGKGRILLRPSGTEALLRVMLEGEDLATITAYADEVVALALELAKEIEAN